MYRIWGLPESDGPPSDERFVESIPEPDQTGLQRVLRHRDFARTSQDVTELKFALAAAQTSEERDRLMARPTPPIILMTGYSSDVTPELLSSSGVCCLLEKPIDHEQLLAALRA